MWYSIDVGDAPLRVPQIANDATTGGTHRGASPTRPQENRKIAGQAHNNPESSSGQAGNMNHTFET